MRQITIIRKHLSLPKLHDSGLPIDANKINISFIQSFSYYIMFTTQTQRFFHGLNKRNTKFIDTTNIKSYLQESRSRRSSQQSRSKTTRIFELNKTHRNSLNTSNNSHLSYTCIKSNQQKFLPPKPASSAKINKNKNQYVNMFGPTVDIKQIVSILDNQSHREANEKVSQNLLGVFDNKNKLRRKIEENAIKKYSTVRYMNQQVNSQRVEDQHVKQLFSMLAKNKTKQVSADPRIRDDKQLKEINLNDERKEDVKATKENIVQAKAEARIEVDSKMKTQTVQGFGRTQKSEKVDFAGSEDLGSSQEEIQYTQDPVQRVKTENAKQVDLMNKLISEDVKKEKNNKGGISMDNQKLNKKLMDSSLKQIQKERIKHEDNQKIKVRQTTDYNSKKEGKHAQQPKAKNKNSFWTNVDLNFQLQFPTASKQTKVQKNPLKEPSKGTKTVHNEENEDVNEFDDSIHLEKGGEKEKNLVPVQKLRQNSESNEGKKKQGSIKEIGRREGPQKALKQSPIKGKGKQTKNAMQQQKIRNNQTKAKIQQIAMTSQQIQDHIEYILDIIVEVCSYGKNLKQFYKQNKVEVFKKEHPILTYYLWQQTLYYRNKCVQTLKRKKEDFFDLNQKYLKTKGLDDFVNQTVEKLIEDEEKIVRSIKKSYELAKQYLKESFVIDKSVNFHQKCLALMHKQFVEIEKIYKIGVKKSDPHIEAYQKKLSQIIEIFCQLKFLNGEKSKEYEEIDEINDFLSHYNRNKHLVRL